MVQGRDGYVTERCRRELSYEACTRWRAREARRLIRFPQMEVLCHTRDWFLELS